MDVKFFYLDLILEKDKKIADLKRQIEKVDKDKRFRDEKNLEIECKVKYVASKLHPEELEENFLGKRAKLTFEDEISLKSFGDDMEIPKFTKFNISETDNKLLLKKEVKFLKSRFQLLKGLLEWRQDQDSYLYKRSSEIILNSKTTSNGVLSDLYQTFGSSNHSNF
jgi:hypothetical protein